MTSKKGRRFIWRAASSLSELQFQLKNSFRMLAPLFRHISKMTAKTATIIEILKFMTNILFSARSFVHHGLTRYNTEKTAKPPGSVTDKLVWMIRLKAFKMLPILVTVWPGLFERRITLSSLLKTGAWILRNNAVHDVSSLNIVKKNHC